MVATAPLVRTAPPLGTRAGESSARPELRALTSLRFFAALAVVVHHLQGSGLFPSGGHTLGSAGVTFFFVLSGFVLTYGYLGRIRCPRDAASFLHRRFARLWPLHAVTLAVSAWQIHRILGVPFADSSSTLLMNLAMLHAWSGEPGGATSYNGPSWSISDEWFFYAVFPFVGLLLSRFGRGATTRKLAIGGVLVWGSLAVATLAIAAHLPPAEVQRWFYLFPPVRLLDFVVGCLFGAAMLRSSTARSARHATRLEALAIAAFAAALVFSPMLPAWGTKSMYWIPPSIALIWAFSSGRGIMSRVVACSPLRVLGEASYSLYMWHMVIIVQVVRLRPTELAASAPALLGLLLLLASIAISLLSWRLVERPARRLLLGQVRVPSPRTVGRWSRAHLGLVTFVVAYAVVMTWSLRIGPLPAWFDAGGYWMTHGVFQRGDAFSLSAWPNPLRGYLLPLVGYLIGNGSVYLGIPDWVALRFVYGGVFVALPTILVPLFVERAFDVRMGILQRLGLVVLFVAFWRGYALFSLSDLVSLALALGAGIAMLGVIMPGSRAGAVRRSWFVTGLLFAAALNVRPSFQVLLPVAMAIGVVWAVRNRRLLDPLIAPVWLLLAVAIVMAPQVAANRAHDRPLNPLHFETEEGRDLYWLLLDFGFRFPKYMTNVGDPAFEQGGVAASDPYGEALYAELAACCTDPAVGTFTYGTYGRFVLEHPLQVTKVYVQHLFNGLDLWHESPYLDRVLPLSTPFRVANWTVLFAALVIGIRRIACARSRGRWLREHWAGVAYSMGILLTVALSIPGSVETRYYLPLHVVAYVLVVTGIRPRIPTRLSRRHLLWLGLLPLYAAWIWLALDQGNDVASRLYS